jgi:hypothetical protein
MHPPEAGQRAAVIAAALLAERERMSRLRPAANGVDHAEDAARDRWRLAALREGQRDDW